MTDFSFAPATIRIGDLEVPRLGFGAMQLPGPGVFGEPKDPDQCRALLRRAVELGVGLIDTSWYYGPLVSNRLIKEALHPYPKHVVIATKLGGRRTEDKGWASALTPEELRRGCEEDLRTLGLDRVDVVHLRWMSHADLPFAESLDALIGLAQEGKIRHIGLSNVTRAQVDDALKKTKIVTVQNLYNVAAGEARLGKLAHAATEGQEALVDFCAERGIAFLPFFPLAVPGPKADRTAIERVASRQGATPTQVAIAWLLGRSKALLPIPGTSSVSHLEENWAARSLSLTKEDLAEISAARG